MTNSRSRRTKPTTILLDRRTDSCEHCDERLRWSKSTSSKPYPFKDFGFRLQVAGLSSATCRSCRTAHAAVGSVKRFRQAVLEEILQRPGALSADDIVFVRRTLGLTGGKFAALVGVSREHVSHIEQGHAPSLGTSADRLARLIVAARSDPSLKLLKRVLASLDEEIGTRSRRKAVRQPGYRVNLGSKRR